MTGDHPRVRCLPWSELDALPASGLDLAFAIDALSEIAATPGGLDRVVRVLRPNAPVIAGELAPSLFWDLVRGTSPTWWMRSASADFPVGALLTGQEWIEDFKAAGFSAATTAPLLGQAGLGVMIRGLAGDKLAARDRAEAPITLSMPLFSWEGEELEREPTLRGLRRHVLGMTGSLPRALLISGFRQIRRLHFFTSCIAGDF